MTIQICVPKEVREDEQRVALVPDVVKRLTKEGINNYKQYNQRESEWRASRGYP